MQVIALVPPVQLLNVLPVTVLFGLEPEPSLLLTPVIAVAPVTVMLEKLLFVKVWVELLGELAPEVEIVTVPPAPVLLKEVTIELLLSV